jgi:hypothetical protein
MSRFSPSVAPEPIDLGAVAQAFAQMKDRRRQRKREDQLDVEHAEDRGRAREAQDLAYYDRGGRRGKPPAEDARTVTLPGEFTLPNTLDFGVGDTPAASSPLDPDAFSEALGRELQRGGPTGSAPPASTSPLTTTPNFSDVTRDTRTPASRHPGAFDPATRTFGGGPAQFATTAAAANSRRPDPWSAAGGARTEQLGPTGKYTVIDDNHYIDETATPAAERAAQREQETLLAAALRGDDITQRAQQQITLERERQEARLAAQTAREDAAAKQSAEHDRRIADLQKELADLRAHTAGTRDADRDKDRRDAKVLRRAQELYKGSGQMGDPNHRPALPWDKAIEQATHEVDSVLGGRAASPTPSRSGAGSSATASTSTMRTPEKAAADALALIRSGQGTLEQALASPNLSPQAKELLKASAKSGRRQ